MYPASIDEIRNDLNALTEQLNLISAVVERRLEVIDECFHLLKLFTAESTGLLEGRPVPGLIRRLARSLLERHGVLQPRVPQ